jgi:hypothetical protein
MKYKDVVEKMNMQHSIVSTIPIFLKDHSIVVPWKLGFKPRKLSNCNVRALSHSIGKNWQYKLQYNMSISTWTCLLELYCIQKILS